MDAKRKIVGPGYQGSDKSGVDAVVYAHGDDPVFSLDAQRGAIEFNGPDAPAGTLSSSAISNVSWTKTLGQASGRFSIDVKTRSPDLFERGILDDDWLDLSFTQHGRKYHVCRGMIDTVRERRRVSNGATERTFTITGRDHGKPFERIQVFFNRYIGENVGGGATLRAFINSNEGSRVFGDVPTTVNAFLFEFLRQLNRSSNARWVVPPGVPGITLTDTGTAVPHTVYFNDAVKFIRDDFESRPERSAYRPMFMDPEGFSGHTLWDLAKEWSDPGFCELFTDLVRKDTLLPPGPDEELRPENSAMGVIIRTKPFPSQVFGTFAQSPWFQLPLHVVTRQEIDDSDEGKGGEERFNTFFVRSVASNEYSNQNVDITKPLWYHADVARRGLLRMDISSNYVSATADNKGMVEKLRELLRDWYGLNAYFKNGTLPLGHGRPEIRVGSRVRIPGASPNEDMTYYVEGITHTWSLGKMRTVLTVTRGWQGTDQDLMRAVGDLEERYSVPSDFTINDVVVDIVPTGTLA